MSTKPLQSPAPGPVHPNRGRTYGMVWACLPVMLALSAATLALFGVSWWTLLVVALLLSCPAAMAVAIYYGYRPLPEYEDRGE
jgi:hypothetical protein